MPWIYQQSKGRLSHNQQFIEAPEGNTMKALLSVMLYLSFFFSAAYAGTNIDYCATPRAWAAQITLAKLRDTGFEPQPLPKVELLSQQKLSGTHPLLSSKNLVISTIRPH